MKSKSKSRSSSRTYYSVRSSLSSPTILPQEIMEMILNNIARFYVLEWKRGLYVLYDIITRNHLLINTKTILGDSIESGLKTTVKESKLGIEVKINDLSLIWQWDSIKPVFVKEFIKGLKRRDYQIFLRTFGLSSTLNF